MHILHKHSQKNCTWHTQCVTRRKAVTCHVVKNTSTKKKIKITRHETQHTTKLIFNQNPQILPEKQMNTGRKTQCNSIQSTRAWIPNQPPPDEVDRLRKETRWKPRESVPPKKVLLCTEGRPATLPAQRWAVVLTHAAHYFHQLCAPAVFIFSKRSHSFLPNFRVSFLCRERRAKE